MFDGSPVFYCQQRVGLNGKEFKLIKFRTMFDRLDSNQGSFHAGQSERVTSLGKFLRRTKIDELPNYIKNNLDKYKQWLE